MNHYLVKLIGFGLAAAISTASIAEDASNKLFEFSGYGTLGITQLDKHDTYYRNFTLSKSGAKDSAYLGTDSVIGLQARGKITDQLGYIIQGVTRTWEQDEYLTKISWAALSYEVSPGLVVRLGRTNTQFFMHSDTLFVNYVREFVRPPVEVYSLAPFRDMDGADVIYRIGIENYLIETQAYVGSSKTRVPSGEIELKDLIGGRASVAKGNLFLQASYANSRVSNTTKSGITTELISALESTGFENVKRDIDGTDGRSTYTSVGFKHEGYYGNVFGEYAKRTNSKYYGSSHAWYLGVSKRIADFTPYYYYAKQRSDKDSINSRTGIDAFDAGLYRLNASRSTAQQSHVAGVRYELMSNTAVKFQVERSRPEEGAWGIFVPKNVSNSEIADGKTVTTVSLGVDFVF